MKINEFLESLGKTEQEVIVNLRRLKVKGIKRCRKNCAILIALRKYCTSPGAQYLRSTYVGDLSYDDCQILDPTVPKPVKDFMINFDKGMYPEFEECKN